MRLQLQALFLVSILLQHSHGLMLNPKTSLAQRNRIHRAAGWESREPAGVENMFAVAQTMSKSQAKRLAEKVKPGSRLTWFPQGGKRRRRRRVDPKDGLHHAGGHVSGHAGQKEVADMIEKISLPPAWEFKNDKELGNLASMKILLQNDFEALTDTTVQLPSGERVSVVTHFPDAYGDVRILRFLRKDRAEDPISASLSFRRYLHWRRDNSVDEVRAAVEARPFAVPPKIQLLSELLPCDFDMNAESLQQGSGKGVLITLFVGKWQTATLASMVRNEEMPLSDFLVYWTYMFESLHKHLYRESVRQSKMVFLDAKADLHGFSLQQLAPSFVSVIVRPWIHQLQSNYPETARRIDVINPPKVVSLLWRLVVPLLSPGTVAKLRIH